VKGERGVGVSDVTVNNTKVCDTFGWNPRITIENGIQEMLK
jgi:nucleoside-diphosphate-sugar epimerase